MEIFEISKKVKLIEIKTRRLSNQIFAGQYQSAFKGMGMTFSEVREYQYGDDMRSIDWNVTARFNHPYVKIFEEERELITMLLIDVSASNAFGSMAKSKIELLTELAGILSFAALKNNDKVGVIFFSDHVEKFIPPKKGQKHILRIIRDLLTYEPKGKGTSINSALEYLNKVSNRRSIVFLISDFMDTGYDKAFGISARKHDLLALRVMDPFEMELPDAGLMMMSDPETGKVRIINTKRKNRKLYQSWWNSHKAYLDNLSMRFSVDVVNLKTDRDYIPPLVSLFKKREKRA
jgi:uncharacterized protein (DUF58 family)